MRVLVAPSELHGLGVFATHHVRAGQEIFSSPLLVLNRRDSKRLRDTRLDHYVWDLPRGRCALALGEASLLNHSDDPNAECYVDEKNRVMAVYATRTIYYGDEITMDYEREPEADDLDEGISDDEWFGSHQGGLGQ